MWTCIGVCTFETVPSSRPYELILLKEAFIWKWGTLDHFVTLGLVVQGADYSGMCQQ